MYGMQSRTHHEQEQLRAALAASARDEAAREAAARQAVLIASCAEAAELQASIEEAAVAAAIASSLADRQQAGPSEEEVHSPPLTCRTSAQTHLAKRIVRQTS